MNLNADQLRAVEHAAGPLLVLAGPGTGKTGVLIERISHLVGERDVDPERVLALTFSRRAADEMRNRITARLPEAEKVEVRTFHSFALSVVRRHAGSLGLRSAPEIVPTAEQWALVSDILGDEDPAPWGLPPGAFERPATVREVYDLMLRAQEHLLEPARLRELGDKSGRPYLDRAGGVLRTYRDRLGSSSKADYEGVVQYALRLLNPGGKTAAEISGLYDHVLVDEFQDTNRSQMELLKRLVPGEKPDVFCVGDDAQCQPEGTMVRVPVRVGAAPGKGYPKWGFKEVPIEEISEGDPVVSYDVSGTHLRVSGSKVLEIVKRPYDGWLIEIETEDGLRSRYTPEHRCVIRIGSVLDGMQAVYLMRRGSRYRLGMAPWRSPSQSNRNGIHMRALAEKADAYWVLSTHDDVKDARLEEAKISYKYNIPTWTFESHNHQTPIDEFWSYVGDNVDHALECLEAFDRDIDAPLWERGQGNLLVKRPVITQASNLMDGMSVLPVDAVHYDSHHRRYRGYTKCWKPVKVKRVHYEGYVYSLKIERDETYVADGIVTHNSIYGFRGARIQNVREFEERFPEAREIHLRTNYRSAAHIVSLAEQAIAGDESRPPRDPQNVSSASKLGTVLHKVAASPREEGDWIADRIVELTQGEGVPREEIAILRRSLLDAAPLVEALASRGIPVDVAVSPGGSSARHLATLLAACAGEDPAPTPASGALVSPLCGVPAEAARALRVSAEASGRSVLGLLRSGDSVGGVPQQEMEGARAVVRAVDASGREESFAARVDSLWKGLPATKDLFERHAEDEEAARALTDALSFVRSAHAYARMSQRPTVEGFLRAGKMLHEDSDTWAPSAPPAEGAVRLLTVHGSKGLEFEAVFASGLVDERFPIRPRGVRFVDPGLLSAGTPTPRAELDRAHLFEERRLFYVALTRAKTYLFLTGVEEPAEDGQKASPFLRELEDRLVELADTGHRRRFWVSREEAVEELRRAACDRTASEPSRFAAARALAGMGERAATWWRYLEPTEGNDTVPELGKLRARDLLLHLECPRRAFMERISSGPARRGGTGRMAFGSVFSDGLRLFLEGEEESLRDALLASVEARDFGGPAFEEYWRRQALDAVALCEAWAKETRERLVSSGGEWEIEVAGRPVRGRHGPVVEESGGRVLLRVKTGKTAMNKADAATDPDLALSALGADVDRARYVYPRKLAWGKPTERDLDTPDGLGGFRAELEAAVGELEEGEIPARPRSAETCGRCAFISICPLHMEEEPWAG